MGSHPDFILKKPHAKNCEGQRQVRLGQRPSPMWLPGQRVENFDGAGRRVNQRRTGHGWLLVECNDPECKAWGIVREKAILALCEEVAHV